MLLFAVLVVTVFVGWPVDASQPRKLRHEQKQKKRNRIQQLSKPIVLIVSLALVLLMLPVTGCFCLCCWLFVPAVHVALLGIFGRG